MTNKKDILLTFSKFQNGTGGTASAIELAITLTKLNYNVTILRYSYEFWNTKVSKDLSEKLTKNNIKIEDSPGFRTYLSEKNKSNVKLSSFKSSSFFSFHNFKNLFKKFIYYCFYRTNKKNFILLSTFDIIFFSEPLFGVELDCIKRNSNAILIQNHAGCPNHVEESVLNASHYPINYDPKLSLYVNFCLSFDYILFQASDQAKNCAEQHPLLEEKVKVLFPTCNEKEIQNAKLLNNPFENAKKNIVNVGTIQPRKDQLSSIMAFDKITTISNVHLHFVGDYNYYPKYYNHLKKVIKSKKIESKVFFHGHRDDYLVFMNNADILIQTSRSEGVSRVLREAMCMKLAIVSFAISGTSGTLKNDYEAILVKENDIDVMGEKLKSLILDKEKHEFISFNAHKKYLLNHSNIAYSQNLSNLINEMIQKRLA